MAIKDRARSASRRARRREPVRSANRPAAPGFIGTLIQRLFQPIDNSSIVFFRIAFGVTSFFHIWALLDAGRVRRNYIDPDFHFSFPGLGWLEPLPGDLMLVLYFGLAAAAILIMLGLFYTPAIIFFFVAHTYAIHLDQAIFWNHYYLISLVAFLMIFVPANRAHSLDVAWRHLPPSDFTSSWTLWILRGQMAITYFFAGVAKLNGDWIDGRPMDAYLAGETTFPFISSIFDDRWLALFLSWGGIAFDISIAPLLLWHKTRIPALIAAFGFHLFNSLTLAIEVFPWFAIAATLLFLAPDWPRRIGMWERVPTQNQPGETHDLPRRWYHLTTVQQLGASVLAIYFVVQVILPLRHYAYPGNVDWTAEGDIWAWRMLIADKTTRTVYVVKNKETSQSCTLRVAAFAVPSQVSKVGYRPDMMAQFGEHVRDRFWDAKRQRVSVHAYSSVSLNGRDFRQIVSPETDLASVSRGLHNDWILPLDPPTPAEEPPKLPPCE